jgi:hypothetical protein
MTEDARSSGEVGSLGEEAAKLFAAVTDWAREHTGESTSGSPAAGKPGSGDPAAGESAAGNSSSSRLGDLFSAEHIATGAPECRWCPLCQAIGMLRTTNPEVKEHLASLVVVAKQILDSVADAVADDAKPDRTSSPDVEHIDLSEDDSWD